jgi:hypothetical protein
MGNAINAKSEALDDLRDLSSDDLDAVSGGGFFSSWLRFSKAETGETGGQNDPAQQFQQIMEQLTPG